jgi:RNA polymerase sigma-70 factor, ECF subfamily
MLDCPHHLLFKSIVASLVRIMKIETIWSEYQSSLKAFLHSKISNPSDVDDLLQEIILKTYSSLDTLKEEDSIKPWLFQIANRTIIDFYRKSSRHNNDLNTEDLWYGDNEHDVKTELSNCITPFIKALPADMAELINAIEIEGKSQKAYAEELGVSYSTLKSRVQKGRKELRTLFDECCHYSLDKFGNLIDFDKKSDNCRNC